MLSSARIARRDRAEQGSADAPEGAGFTLVEMVIVLAILGVVMRGLIDVLDGSMRTYEGSSARMAFEARGARLFDKLIDALREAKGDALDGVPEQPLWVDSMVFQRSNGGGQVEIWGPPEELSVNPETGELEWRINPGLPDEALIDSIGGIAALQSGELTNGLDDNGNLLLDEPGLCITRDGDTLLVYLTLENLDPDGFNLTRSWSARVYFRN